MALNNSFSNSFNSSYKNPKYEDHSDKDGYSPPSYDTPHCYYGYGDPPPTYSPPDSYYGGGGK